MNGSQFEIYYDNIVKSITEKEIQLKELKDQQLFDRAKLKAQSIVDEGINFMQQLQDVPRFDSDIKRAITWVNNHVRSAREDYYLFESFTQRELGDLSLKLADKLFEGLTYSYAYKKYVEATNHINLAIECFEKAQTKNYVYLDQLNEMRNSSLKGENTTGFFLHKTKGESYEKNE